jgi:hypothetical protein
LSFHRYRLPHLFGENEYPAFDPTLDRYVTALQLKAFLYRQARLPTVSLPAPHNTQTPMVGLGTQAADPQIHDLYTAAPHFLTKKTESLRN